MRYFAWLLIITALASSCGNDEAKETGNLPETEDSATVYYPINNYIRRQIQDVDSTPYFLYRLQKVGGKKDSSVVSRADFDNQVKAFVLNELDEKQLRLHFTESVFDDASTNSITLTYTPKTKGGIVQNASVLLNKENQSVKWILINTLNSSADSTVIQRISWKGDESCTLNTSVTYTNKKPEQQRLLSFVWNVKKEE